ncbi:hypothetical protein BBP40_011742 [Aspergillus hancockii]|nr:hypothetical protein BBP40_011742 [Aspergillus hancockii]
MHTMRIPASLSSVVLSSALLPTLSTASGFDCAHINVDGFKYDLSPLGGVHSLYHVEQTETHVVNTTYVLNICNILKGASIRGHLKCGTSKNICGFQYKYPVDGSEESSRAFPIVGLEHLGHGSKDPEITRLKKLDTSEEGLLVKLSGGNYVDDEGKKKDAGAVVEFQCDPERTGLEGLKTTNDDRDEKEKKRRRREEGDKDGKEQPPTDRSQSLEFKSFGKADDDSYVLKLNWRTNLFLCVAAYLIFGSWLNYNRYGARGWDLLPHGDTIRDIPYLFQDWLRRVVNTIQGSGSRGGYSAV